MSHLYLADMRILYSGGLPVVIEGRNMGSANQYRLLSNMVAFEVRHMVYKLGPFHQSTSNPRINMSYSTPNQINGSIRNKTYKNIQLSALMQSTIF